MGIIQKPDSIKSSNLSKTEEIKKRTKFGKLLFFHQNKMIYLRCQLYSAGVVIMCRLVFFVLLFVYDSESSILSLLLLGFLAYCWYNAVYDHKVGVRMVNNLTIVFILFKYLVSMLDIRKGYYHGQDPGLTTSIVSRILPDNSTYYKLFKELNGA